MRIAQFHATLPAPDRKPGGVEMHVRRLAGELASRGHDVTLLAFDAPGPLPGVRVRRLGRPVIGRSKLARTAVAPWLLSRVDPTAFDVLHLHGDDWFFFNRRLPTVRTMHGSALDEARLARRWRRKAYQGSVFPLEVLAARLATAAYGLTPEDRRAYRLAGALGTGPSMDVAPGSDAERTTHPTILFVGEWSGRKRGELLYEQFRSVVRPARPDAELWLVCDAPVAPEPGVRLLGRLDDAELARRYRQAWVFCLPSAYEGLGLPYVEAMASGTPVVATPNPGARHALDGGRAGRLAPAQELGTALLELLGDPAARASLTRAGLERAADFTWAAAVDRHEEAYRRAVAAWSARRS